VENGDFCSITAKCRQKKAIRPKVSRIDP
jgi:hypothetical protein